MSITRILPGLLITVVAAIYSQVADQLPSGFIANLEQQSYDIRVRLSATDQLDDRVVIVDIDERSLQEIGQWPFPRSIFARLVDRLFDDYKIDTLGFDISFPEPEQRYTDQRLSQVLKETQDAQQLLARLREQSGDKLLAQSIKGRKVVLGSVFEKQSEQSVLIPSYGQLSSPLFGEFSDQYRTIISETNAPVATRHTSNTPLLANAAAATGFFSISSLVGDHDGIIRRVDLMNRFNNKLYANMALQLVQTYLGIEARPVLVGNADDGYQGLERLDFGVGDFPIDKQAAVYVPYAKPGARFEYIPMVDILNQQYPGSLEHAIVIVGTSAQAMTDLRSTPVSPALPGVEVHANLVTAILDAVTFGEPFRAKPQWVDAADLLTIVFIGVLLALALPYLSAFWSTALYLLTLFVLLGSNWYFWSERLLILNLALPLLLATTLYVLNMVSGFFIESRARRTTQKMFGLYVPPKVVDQISQTTDIFSLKSERKQLSVLFCDIRNFTSISENMDAQTLSEWLNQFLTPMTQIIHEHGGAIDKYMGDAIMAFWGAPIDDPDHAKNAVMAGLAMIHRLDKLNEEYRARNWPELAIGIGINSGLMSVGNMGSEFRMAYTVIGDAVNLGSRLESLTKQYATQIIVSEFTRAQAPDFNYQQLDTVKVKGKNKAVTIYACDPDLNQA